MDFLFGARPRAFLILICLFGTNILGAHAAPLNPIEQALSLLASIPIGLQPVAQLPLPPPRVANETTPVSLRILPLGNSITFGYLSTDGNGYRNDLLTMLTANGTSVQYIGSVRAGNMTDNFNEGHPGAVITQIATYANLSLPQRPNIILLMAGTNDMATSLNLTTAPDRLGSLIDQCHNICPDATILVAQLTPAAINITQTNIDSFNPLIPALVEDRVWKGVKVLSVDMTSFVSLDDLVDGLHPNDGGYAKMAAGWMEGLQEASVMGWITPPVTV